jgi:hypothetical protein
MMSDPIACIHAADAELNRLADEANAKIRATNQALQSCHMAYPAGSLQSRWQMSRDGLSWNETTTTWQLHWMGRPLLECNRMNRIQGAKRIDDFLVAFAKYAEEQASEG